MPRRADQRCIPQLRHGFERRVSCALPGPFTVLFILKGAHQADDSRGVAEETRDIGVRLDLDINPLVRAVTGIRITVPAVSTGTLGSGV